MNPTKGAKKVSTYQSDGITAAFSNRFLYLVFYLCRTYFLDFYLSPLIFPSTFFPVSLAKEGARNQHTNGNNKEPPLRKKKEKKRKEGSKKKKKKGQSSEIFRWFLSQASTAQRQSQIPLLVSRGPPSSLNEPGGRWLGGCRGDLLLAGSAPVTKGAGVRVRIGAEWDCRRDGYNAFG